MRSANRRPRIHKGGWIFLSIRLLSNLLLAYVEERVEPDAYRR
jgi:hypothetical protein